MIFRGLSRTERLRFVWVTAAFMCVTSAALVARTAADALFLTHYAHHYLSYMYVGTALVVSVVAFALSTLIGRLHIVRLIAIGVTFLVGVLLCIRAGLLTNWHPIRILAYFSGDLVVHVPMMLFWGFAVLLFDPRQAKKLFGFVGAGGTLSCILSGYIVKPFSLEFGTQNLLFLVVLLLCLFLLLVLQLSRLQPSSASTSHTSSRSQSHVQQISQQLRNRQIGSLIGLIFVSNVALAIIDYQFKAGARHHFAPNELAGFFGDFYATTSIVALFIQLFLVHRILQKGSVKLGLSILPTGILMGCVGILLTSDYNWIVLTKGTVQIFLFTIDIAAIQMLYMGVPVASRNQARAFADGITKPIAMAVAGIGLVVLTPHVPLPLFAIAGCVLATLWLFIASKNSKAYVSALIDSLDTRRFDISAETAQLQDQMLASHLKEALKTAQNDEILYLLSLANDMENLDWTDEYRTLLNHELPQIKVAAIRHLKDHGTPEDIETLMPLLAHANETVRAETIYTISFLGGPEYAESLVPSLDDPHPDVRAASIASLFNTGDLDALIDAGITLRDLIHSDDFSHRIAATRALTHIQNSARHRLLAHLLEDENLAVQKAALETCQTHPDPKLLPYLIPLLDTPYLSEQTADVLPKFGEPAQKALLAKLEQDSAKEHVTGTVHIPRILTHLSDHTTLPTLFQTAQTRNYELKKTTCQAIGNLLKHAPNTKNYQEPCEQLIRDEMQNAFKRKIQILSIPSVPSTDLLSNALQHLCHQHLQNAFALIDGLFPKAQVNNILAILIRPDANHSNALEILDNILPKTLKQEILPFFEQEESQTLTSWDLLQQIVTSESETWLLSGCLIALHQNSHIVSAEKLIHCLSHPHPAVREISLFMLNNQNQLALIPETHPIKKDADKNIQKLLHLYFEPEDTAEHNAGSHP